MSRFPVSAWVCRPTHGDDWAGVAGTEVVMGEDDVQQGLRRGSA